MSRSTRAAASDPSAAPDAAAAADPTAAAQAVGGATRGDEPRTSAPSLVVWTEPGPLPEGLEELGSGTVLERVESLTEIEPEGVPNVVLLTDGLLSTGAGADTLRELPEWLVPVTRGENARHVAEVAGRLFDHLADDAGGAEMLRTLRSAGRHSAALLAAGRSREELERLHGQVHELNRVGMALMSERDPDRLLDLILSRARALTESDAGSLYLKVEGEDGAQRLHFRLAQNDTLPDLPTPDFTLPIDRSSLAGYAASTGEPLVLDDAYRIPEDRSYSFNTAFDREHGYRAKSMLVVPMKDQKERVVGVLQLINRKSDPEARITGEETAERYVLPYRRPEIEMVRSLAGQAAVSIENGRLYRAIEDLFEGFIRAAVTAIDQRDPATSGHSVRVTALTCDLAEVVSRSDDPPFADVSFSPEEMQQLRYAGLLHDVGKVGVPEEVLVKQKKLPPAMSAGVQARFDLIRTSIEAEYHRRRAERLEETGDDYDADHLREIEKRRESDIERLERYRQAVLEANEPRVLAEEAGEILGEIAEAVFTGPDGEERPYLTEEEVHYLRIPRGNLDPAERKQIESHVEHSHSFLREIPWTDELGRIADIVIGHHEKLDGRGYPRGVAAEEIPLETRMMTVADIFDALTASDRPYKKAMPVERALEILRMEAEEGGLDADLVEVFIESRIYERVLDTDWRTLEL